MMKSKPTVVAHVSLVAYGCVGLLSLLLATPGGYVPVYALMCAIGVVPAMSDSRKVRLAAIPLVVLAALLVMYDWQRGATFQQQRAAILRNQSAAPWGQQ